VSLILAQASAVQGISLTSGGSKLAVAGRGLAQASAEKQLLAVAGWEIAQASAEKQLAVAGWEIAQTPREQMFALLAGEPRRVRGWRRAWDADAAPAACRIRPSKLSDTD
jgi:hypothetical protein